MRLAELLVVSSTSITMMLRRSYLVLLCLTLLTLAAGSQAWHLIGPYGGLLQGEIASTPSGTAILADYRTGAYVTSDRGQHWTDLGERIPPLSVSADKSGLLYFTTGYGKLYRFDAVTSVRTTLFDSSLGEPIIGVSPNGLHLFLLFPHLSAPLLKKYYSSDRGASWSASVFTMPNPSKVVAMDNGVAIMSADRLYETNGGSATVRVISDSLGYGCIAFIDTMEIYHTGLAGRSLSVTGVVSGSPAADAKMTAVAVDSAGAIYMSSGRILYRRLQTDTSWSMYLEAAGEIVDLAVSGKDQIYIATRDRGIYVHTIPSNSTLWASSGINNIAVTEFRMVGDSGMLAGGGDAGAFYSSTAGAPWRRINEHRSPQASFYTGLLASSRTSPYIFFHATGSALGNAARSTDLGLTWEEIHNAPPGSMVMMANGELLADYYSSRILHRSVDSGISWEALTQKFSGLTGRIIESTPSGRLTSRDNSNLLLASSDAGNSWMRWTPPTGVTRWLSFHSSNESFYFALKDGKLFRTSDGVDWKELLTTDKQSQYLHSNPPLYFFADSRGFLYVYSSESVSYRGLFRSIDNGDNWAKVAPPISAPDQLVVYDMMTDSSDGIYAATSRGIFATTVTLGTARVDVQQSSQKLVRLGLNQYWFSQSTGGSPVSLRVIDAKGSIVKTEGGLESGYLSLKGLPLGWYHIEIFDGGKILVSQRVIVE